MNEDKMYPHAYPDRGVETATSAFDKALRTVNEERGADYGPPEENFKRAATLRDVVHQCSDPELREALGNIADKVARLVHSPDHLDSWIDIAGYARCGCMIIDAKAKRRSRDADLTVFPAGELRGDS